MSRPTITELVLTRSQPGPWGFRLQGGADFEKALTVVVTDGSHSYNSGLRTGDVILGIGSLEASLLTHKQAQDAIVKSADHVPLTVQRMAPDVGPAPGTWKPSVEIVGAPATGPAPLGATYTKTSLAANTANQVPEEHWDVKYNATAKGFQAGTDPGLSNSSGGMGGPSANAPVPGFRSVGAPVTRPGAGGGSSGPPAPPQMQTCWSCAQPIRGVFLQVKGRPLHAECFTCATCQTSLKNVGHFVIGEKLYCQLHATEAQNKLIGDQGGSNPAGGPVISPGGAGGGGMPAGLAANLAKLTINQPGQRNSGTGGLPQPPPPPPTAAADNPAAADWNRRLNSNTAGMAANADDFTKEFMKQLTGGN